MKINRRTLIKDALLLIAAGSILPVSTIAAEVLSLLQETDPEAVAIGYISNARKVDKSKFPAYETGQTCTNCALVVFSSAIRKPCSLVPGKLVMGGGWCTKWVKKV